MFGAALVVFRESFEAALLIGILAAAMKNVPGRNRWLAIGVAGGVVGALIVAALTDVIAQAAGGAGQELFVAGILGVAVLMLAWHNIWMQSHGAELARTAKKLGADVSAGARALSSVAVLAGVAVLREGSETALFLYGILAGAETSWREVAGGGAIGMGAGVAVGWLVYTGLLRIPMRQFFAVIGALLLFLAAGLASQMARFLIQADYLPAGASPLWDTSWLISNDSFVGSMLRILIGYDAQPSSTQVIFYVATLAAILIATRIVREQKRRTFARKPASTPGPTTGPAPAAEVRLTGAD